MKPYQIVLTVITVLALNNLALLSFIGHFSEQKNDTIDVASNGGGITLSEAQRSDDEKTSNSATSLASEQQDKTDLTQEFENYVRSEQFSAVITDWQRKSRKRNQEISARLVNMNADELYAVAFESENINEKSMALYQLTQGSKYKQLSNEKLKGLYSEDGNDGWARQKFLSTLLERDDSEALGWAKQLITGTSVSRTSSELDIYSKIYEKDPEFMKQHVAETEFSDTPRSFDLFTFLQTEPKLAGPFFTRNFDKILKSQNDDIFKFGMYGIANIELTQQQQLDVTKLFKSKNSNKRNFANSLIEKIDDIQALRGAYAGLRLARDKDRFIGSLLQSGENTEKLALGKEFAANSDDPNVQRLADSY